MEFMFSYRHAFHAGNHADVLKHLTLIATLQHLTQKDTPLTLIDAQAGAGLYRLDGDYAQTSSESADGIFKLLGQSERTNSQLIKDYLALIAKFNSGNKGAIDTKIYPGSPFLMQKILRPDDRLRLFELHPSDHRLLETNVAELRVNRQVMVKREDSFEALKAMLPPPANSTGSRRGFVLIDPSYEIKSDYAKVEQLIQDSLKRFATGCYAVWYPIIPRPEAHGLPRRLKTLANQSGKPFVHATLSIGQRENLDAVGTYAAHRSPTMNRGLSASGMVVINPPHTLKDSLKTLLPELVQRLGRGKGQGFTLE
jgi:23S rRNA (adenine2030-N6)-methyltransferase